jgi:hypothetical protein
MLDIFGGLIYNPLKAGAVWLRRNVDPFDETASEDTAKC